MKKKTKKFFGLVGLALVVGVTAVACSLPSQEAQAVQSLTDTIQVRVVGDTPDVRFNNIENRNITVYPWQSFSVEYENVADYTLTLTYTDRDGNTTSNIIDSQFVDYATYAKDYTLELNTGGYDYGKYVLTVSGTTLDGVRDFDERIFYYYPAIGDVAYDEETGYYALNLEYATEKEGGEVKTLLVEIYDNNTPVDSFWVDAPLKSVVLPREGKEDNYKSGDLRVEISAWSITKEEGELTDENRLYTPYELIFEYDSTLVPNTGSFLRELNISREDYLITGLIVFGTVAIAGMVFLKKTDTNKKRAHVNTKQRRRK